MKLFIKNLIYRLRGDHTTEYLIKKGLRVGKNFNRMVGVIIDPSHCHHIKIGNDVTLAPRVHILAHDASIKVHLGYARIGNVEIGDRVFIGADSVIMPGVSIGDDVIIGANSTVAHSIPSGWVVAGCPAVKKSTIAEFLDKHRRLMEIRPMFDESYSFRCNPTEKMKAKMFEDLSDFGPGYII